MPDSQNGENEGRPDQAAGRYARGNGGGPDASGRLLARVGAITGRPSPNGVSGERDGRGRFALGCKGGPGNPHARQTAEFRRLLLDAAGDRFEAIVAKLIELAVAGEPWAMREVLDRVLGRPTAAVELTTPEAASMPIRVTFGTMTPEQQARLDELAKIGLAKLARDTEDDVEPSRPGGEMTRATRADRSRPT